MKNLVLENVVCKIKPQNIDDFMEHKWLADKGVGYPNMSVEEGEETNE